MKTKIQTWTSNNVSFAIMIAIFVVACVVFADRPQIAMWIGFALAGYSAVANDSIQTVGTFLVSNSKSKWWVHWIFLGSVMAVVLFYGWYVNSGDLSYGRLESIPQPATFNYFQLLAPITLLILTRFKMPVSTTFLLLSVFSTSNVISGMLLKTLVGYFIAFIVSLIVWGIIAEVMRKIKMANKPYNQKLWGILQWFSTAYLWTSWLMQDAANVTVYLPRSLSLNYMLIVIGSLVLGMGLLLYLKGGRIQEIITEKSDVVNVRSATMIDFVYATILVIFKEWNHLPMSTTWVFLGLLAGREIALARLSGNDKPYNRTLMLVTKDLAYAVIGVVISLALAILASDVSLGGIFNF